ncbi:MAG: LacI family DNA-binding transcriptional regulator [Clostridia bacterium]|nr:LacI family DNA-binding transcriptional regulator [Clostridia bacterium]
MKRFSKITTTQLARICGVSQGTVDRALHNRVGISEETRKRILTVAREYDYRPSSQVGGQENSMLIGVVLLDLYNEFFSRLAMSLVSAAREFGYSIIFQFSEKDPRNEKTALEYFDYIGVDGIILFSIGSDSEEYKNYLQSLKKPIVLIGNRLFNLPFVGIDDEKAMFELTKRFAEESSLSEILYFAPALKKDLNVANAQRLRLNGFREAMCTLQKTYRVLTEVTEITASDGVICGTDHYALQVLKHLGYPKDVRLAGFDNISALKELPIRMLSVEYPIEQIAQESINYLLGRRYRSVIAHKLVYNTE